MRETVARCVVAIGAGLALIVAQGWKNEGGPGPVQRMVSSSSGPEVQPDSPVRSLPGENVDPAARPKAKRAARRPYQVQPVQAQSREAQAAAFAAAQRQQDERLLEEQQAASQRQQEELDQEIERNLRTQQEMEAEPRIQDIPEAPIQPAPLEPMQPQ